MRNKTVKRQRGGEFITRFVEGFAKKAKNRVDRVFSRKRPLKGFKKGFKPKGYRQEEVQPYENDSNTPVQEDPTPQYSNSSVQCPIPLPPSDFTDADVQAYSDGLKKLSDAEVKDCFIQLMNEAPEFYKAYKKLLGEKMEYYREDEPPPLQGGRRIKKQTRRNSKR